MNYQQAVDYIHSLGRFGSKPGLSRIGELLKQLGSPEKQLKFVHVAGTNGKGSTAAFIAGMLGEAGYRTGLYISPYLESFNERIQINRCPISEDKLAELVTSIKPLCHQLSETAVGHPTQFEIITALAMQYYALEQVDIVVLEVGLGGRFDATNIIPPPEVGVITSIGLDHQAVLGDTIPEIAAEKAGIIKPHMTLVTGVRELEAREVIAAKVEQEAGQLYALDRDFKARDRQYRWNGQSFKYLSLADEEQQIQIALNGRHQVDNACVAIAAVEVLNKKGFEVSWEAVKNGISKVNWPGRMEVIRQEPLVILDGAHNSHGTKALKNSLQELARYQKIISVIGILKDKDFAEMIEDIASLSKIVIITAPDYYRAIDTGILVAEALNYCQSVLSVTGVANAVSKAILLAEKNDLVLITGSLYTIGEARTFLRNTDTRI